MITIIIIIIIMITIMTILTITTTIRYYTLTISKMIMNNIY